jgi:hypothetical protein
VQKYKDYSNVPRKKGKTTQKTQKDSFVRRFLYTFARESHMAQNKNDYEKIAFSIFRYDFDDCSTANNGTKRDACCQRAS